MYKFALLPALLFLVSCNSPEARLERLQHDFWEKFARQDFFEIKLKNEVLHLPLPPSPYDLPKGQQTWAESLQKEANSIEKEKLSTENQKQLTQIRSALDDCVARAGNPMFDPSRCSVSAQLQQYAEYPELPALLEKIPNYYAQVEQLWQTPDVRFVPKAVNESQTALDLLNELEKKAGKEVVAEARAAIKDFIGLCQSAVLVK